MLSISTAPLALIFQESCMRGGIECRGGAAGGRRPGRPAGTHAEAATGNVALGLAAIIGHRQRQLEFRRHVCSPRAAVSGHAGLPCHGAPRLRSWPPIPRLAARSDQILGGPARPGGAGISKLQGKQTRVQWCWECWLAWLGRCCTAPGLGVRPRWTPRCALLEGVPQLASRDAAHWLRPAGCQLLCASAAGSGAGWGGCLLPPGGGGGGPLSLSQSQSASLSSPSLHSPKARCLWKMQHSAVQWVVPSMVHWLRAAGRGSSRAALGPALRPARIAMQPGRRPPHISRVRQRPHF